MPTQYIDRGRGEVVAAQRFFDGMVVLSAEEFWARTSLAFNTPRYMEATADHQFLVHDIGEGASIANHLSVEAGTMIRSFAYTGEITFDVDAGTNSERSGMGPDRADSYGTHPVAVALFHALTKVRWDSGDGGYLKKETLGPGDAENTQGFGPVAADDPALAIVTAAYLNTQGELVGWDKFKV